MVGGQQSWQDSTHEEHMHAVSWRQAVRVSAGMLRVWRLWGHRRTDARTNDGDEHLCRKHGPLLLQLCHEGQHVGGQLRPVLVQDCVCE